MRFCCFLLIACLLPRLTVAQSLTVPQATKRAAPTLQGPEQRLVRRTPQLEIQTAGGEFERYATALEDHDPDAFNLDVRWGRPLYGGTIYWQLSRNGQVLNRQRIETLDEKVPEAQWRRTRIDLRSEIRRLGRGSYDLHVVAVQSGGIAQSAPVRLALIADDGAGRTFSDLAGPRFRQRAFVDLHDFAVKATKEGTPEPYLVAYLLVLDDDSVNVLTPADSEVRLLSNRGTHGNVTVDNRLYSGVPLSADAGYFEFEITPIGLEEWQDEGYLHEQLSVNQLEQATTATLIVTAMEQNNSRRDAVVDIKNAVAADMRAQLNTCLDDLSMLDMLSIAEGVRSGGDVFRSLDEELTAECVHPSQTRFTAVLRDGESIEDLTFFTFLQRRTKEIARARGIEVHVFQPQILDFAIYPFQLLANATKAGRDKNLGVRIETFTLPQMERTHRFELRYQIDEDYDADNPDHVARATAGEWYWDYEWDYRIGGVAGICDASRPRRPDGRCERKPGR